MAVNSEYFVTNLVEPFKGRMRKQKVGNFVGIGTDEHPVELWR